VLDQCWTAHEEPKAARNLRPLALSLEPTRGQPCSLPVRGLRSRDVGKRALYHISASEGGLGQVEILEARHGTFALRPLVLYLPAIASR
jgi:hypothetical protein